LKGPHQSLAPKMQCDGLDGFSIQFTHQAFKVYTKMFKLIDMIKAIFIIQ
jgi:hypothetical protein